MNQDEAEILSAAIALSSDAKVRLIEQLLDSFSPIDQEAIDELWRIEIERRITDFEEGREKSIPAEEVFMKLRRP